MLEVTDVQRLIRGWRRSGLAWDEFVSSWRLLLAQHASLLERLESNEPELLAVLAIKAPMIGPRARQLVALHFPGADPDSLVAAEPSLVLDDAVFGSIEVRKWRLSNVLAGLDVDRLVARVPRVLRIQSLQDLTEEFQELLTKNKDKASREQPYLMCTRVEQAAMSDHPPAALHRVPSSSFGSSWRTLDWWTTYTRPSRIGWGARGPDSMYVCGTPTTPASHVFIGMLS